ncbi:heme ABC transporter ATP-binding protein [Dehalococcoidia bacterium]|nr:heme ABC transporter ATP-binding protein [Dehalococcoidia bacterium]
MKQPRTLMVDAKNLVYQVEQISLLEQVNLTVAKGQLLGVIGPNGAGKSTLLKTIAGLLHPQRGSITLAENTLEDLSPKEISRTLALVPQIAPYTLGFTALELVLMGRYPHLGRFQIEGQADTEIARKSMRLTETEQFANRTLETLSGGERQRVFLARALAQEPRILLLDEPTANLDILHQLKVFDLMKDLVAHGMTAIAVIHDLPMAARYCDRLVLLSKGHVLAEGLPEEVLTPQNIEHAFGVKAVVFRDPMTATLTVSLLSQADGLSSPVQNLRVHVVCGGGSGAGFMYDLQHAGFTVTACALGSGDTDRLAADILGIDYVAVTAFGEIDDNAHQKHLTLIKSADHVVLCPIAFGTNNLRNLEAVSEAKSFISIDSEGLTQRDFTDGLAKRLFEKLPHKANFRTIREAFDHLNQPLQEPQS